MAQFGVCENACSTSDAYKLKEIISDSVSNTDLMKNYKIINTGTIGKFVPKWGGKRMTYLGLKLDYPVVNKREFLKKFPNSYGRKASKPKLILKGLNLLDCSLDMEGEIIPGKTTLMVTSNNEQNLLWLSGFLNSKVVFFYLKEKYSAYSYNTGVSFTKQMINELPLPNLGDNDMELIKSICQRIISIKKKDLDDDIADELSELDVVLCSLYGLSKQQIEFVRTF